MALEIQILAWDRHQNVAVLSTLMGSQTIHYQEGEWFEIPLSRGRMV
jgi:hypothetical protein